MPQIMCYCVEDATDNMELSGRVNWMGQIMWAEWKSQLDGADNVC